MEKVVRPTQADTNEKCCFCLFQFSVKYGNFGNLQGCHGQGKVRENQKFFKVREKSGNFAKGQGKSQFLSKSVKSQGILFSGFVKFMKTFSSEKKKL